MCDNILYFADDRVTNTQVTYTDVQKTITNEPLLSPDNYNSGIIARAVQLAVKDGVDSEVIDRCTAFAESALIEVKQGAIITREIDV